MVAHKQKSAFPVVARHTQPVSQPGPTTQVDVSDADLEDRIRQRLDEANISARNTIAVRVTDGRATTAGVVPSRAALDEVERTVRSVAGVRGFCNLAVIDRHRADDARSAAQALSDAISFECAQSDVDVSVFGKTAVVTGCVDKPDDRLNVEVIAQSQQGVENVVNRTTVVAAGHDR